MTSHIAKIVKIALTTLAIFPLALTLKLSPVRAESPTSSIGDITNITEQIARNPLAPATRQSPQDSTDTEVSAERERSMDYVRQGIQAQKAGNIELALKSCKKALKADENNPYAYLLASLLMSDEDTENAINCAKAAAKLSVDQHDREAYDLSIELLELLQGNA
jgi:tetratricopeptide (TPR) repeat protein